MRFVAVKTPEQQAVLMLHKTRDLLGDRRSPGEHGASSAMT
jgi:hypothetical protein